MRSGRFLGVGQSPGVPKRSEGCKLHGDISLASGLLLEPLEDDEPSSVDIDFCDGLFSIFALLSAKASHSLPRVSSVTAIAPGSGVLDFTRKAFEVILCDAAFLDGIAPELAKLANKNAAEARVC